MPGSSVASFLSGQRFQQDRYASYEPEPADDYMIETSDWLQAEEQQRRALEAATANVALADQFVQARWQYEQRLGVFADARAALVLGSLLGAVGGPVGALVGIGIAAWMPSSPSVRGLQGW